MIWRPAVVFSPVVAKVAKAFGIGLLSAPRPELWASFATGQFSTAARLSRPSKIKCRVGPVALRRAGPPSF
jgi:hypothetical protein